MPFTSRFPPRFANVRTDVSSYDRTIELKPLKEGEEGEYSLSCIGNRGEVAERIIALAREHLTGPCQISIEVSGDGTVVKNAKVKLLGTLRAAEPDRATIADVGSYVTASMFAILTHSEALERGLKDIRSFKVVLQQPEDNESLGSYPPGLIANFIGSIFFRHFPQTTGKDGKEYSPKAIVIESKGDTVPDLPILTLVGTPVS